MVKEDFTEMCRLNILPALHWQITLVTREDEVDKQI